MPNLRPKIGIIGGRGLLGSWFANFLSKQGISVEVSDQNTELTNKAIVERCNVIIFSVPIRVTEKVIDEVAPYVTNDQMLVDLTSLKSKPVAAMLRSKAEVLGLHPMFGPPIESMKSQIIVVCKARPGTYTDWFLELLRGDGAILKESTPEIHDKTMAVVQGLNHLSSIAMAIALKKLGVDVAETLTYSSPVYRMRLDLVARIMAQDAELYCDIALENRETIGVLDAFGESVDDLCKIIKSINREEFLTLFKEASDQLGSFRESGVYESDRLIEFLANLKSH